MAATAVVVARVVPGAMVARGVPVAMVEFPEHLPAPNKAVGQAG